MHEWRIQLCDKILKCNESEVNLEKPHAQTASGLVVTIVLLNLFPPADITESDTEPEGPDQHTGELHSHHQPRNTTPKLPVDHFHEVDGKGGESQ